MTAWLASYENVIALVLLNGILGLAAWLMLVVNRFSLATGGLMSLGAYVAVLGTTRFELPFLVALAAGAAAGAVAALLLGTPVLRLEGDYFALATLAFTEVVRVVALNWDSMTGGALGIVGIPVATDLWHLGIAVTLLVGALAWARWSWIGRVLEVTRQDDMAAQAIGIDVARVRLAVFVASGAVCGAAGGLAGHLSAFIGPDDFGMSRSIDAIAYAVLGGVSGVAGPLLGAAVYTVLPEALRFSAQGREIVIALIVVAVVLFLPRGLTSVGDRPWWRRGLAGSKSRIAGTERTAPP